eukprot:6470044-Pyramimonas_sp.AAC.2
MPALSVGMVAGKRVQVLGCRESAWVKGHGSRGKARLSVAGFGCSLWKLAYTSRSTGVMPTLLKPQSTVNSYNHAKDVEEEN